MPEIFARFEVPEIHKVGATSAYLQTFDYKQLIFRRAAARAVRAPEIPLADSSIF